VNKKDEFFLSGGRWGDLLMVYNICNCRGRM